MNDCRIGRNGAGAGVPQWWKDFGSLAADQRELIIVAILILAILKRFVRIKHSFHEVLPV
jgi:hypothetical protein